MSVIKDQFFSLLDICLSGLFTSAIQPGIHKNLETIYLVGGGEQGRLTVTGRLLQNISALNFVTICAHLSLKEQGWGQRVILLPAFLQLNLRE